MATSEEYEDRAATAIRDLLDSEHALVVMEAEARIAERGFVSSRDNINPHHITTALRQLQRAGVIVFDSAVARGGQKVETIQPADQARRGTRIARVAARKRLLLARYLGWAQGGVRHPKGLIGPAGEASVRSALQAAGTLIPATRGAGEVSRILGVDLPGSADSGGLIVPMVAGIPGTPITVLIEVKNIRGWLYPQSVEVYQLLHKATVVARVHPDQPILPVLVCRKAHWTLYPMARQLGFMVIEMNRQYAGDVGEDEVTELRAELHFQDLVAGSMANVRVQDRVRDVLPKHGPDFAVRWRDTVLDERLSNHFQALRHEKTVAGRARQMASLRAASKAHGFDGGW